MTIDVISNDNLKPLTELILDLWTECIYDEEFENCKTILESERDICYLAKEKENYIAFIHLSIRSDYVEGANTSTTAYIEALFVRDRYRNNGIARKLLNHGEEWARHNGCSQIASDTELHNSSGIDFHKKIGFKEVNRIVCFLKEL